MSLVNNVCWLDLVSRYKIYRDSELPKCCRVVFSMTTRVSKRAESKSSGPVSDADSLQWRCTGTWRTVLPLYHYSMGERFQSWDRIQSKSSSTFVLRKYIFSQFQSKLVSIPFTISTGIPFNVQSFNLLRPGEFRKSWSSVAIWQHSASMS